MMLAVYCAGGFFLTRRALEEVRPRYLESMEETLVDTSVLLASVLETQLVDGRLDAGGLQRAFGAAERRRFEAKIFSLRKTNVDLRVYVTDGAGKLIFDSEGAELGSDYSQWNDVSRTLRGEYGARSTRAIEGDDDTQSLFVAAPIRHDGEIVGVLSVGKPTRGVNHLVSVAQRRVLRVAVIGGLIVLLLLLLVASWVIAPLERLTAYARAVRDGRAVTLPVLPGRTLSELGRAFEEMRDALEGRQHVERYTQALAHEVKAPLAAIRGAAELLDEDMPVEQRRKFMTNIRDDAGRIQQIVERLLELSVLEARKNLRTSERIVPGELVNEAVEVMRGAFNAKGVALNISTGATDLALQGERMLLREALVNLLQNALDFSPAGSPVTIALEARSQRLAFVVEDEGPGVPDYALSRVFERFYSLPRPDNARKSTGIGLALVREIAHLHGGEALLENRAAGGARATLVLPTQQAR
jgi:two-component system sensor histidine kinase CreC